MKAINISLFDYNTGTFLGDTGPMRDIIARNNYAIITIDDVGQTPRTLKGFPEWMKGNRGFVHSFTFHDSEESSEGCFSAINAASVAADIISCKSLGLDLVVSCIAGLSRSGAIVQAAIDYGFEDTGRIRTPNNRIKGMVREALGIEINASTSMFN